MKEFIISCNIKRFDLISYVEQHGFVYWKQTKQVSPGDNIYIYVGVPYSRLYYKCKVLESNLEECPENMPFYMEKRPKTFMKIGDIKELTSDGLRLNEILRNGVKTVQCSTEVSPEFRAYLSKLSIE